MKHKRLVRAFVWAKVLEEIGSAWFFPIYGLFLIGLHLNEWEYVGVNIVYMITRTMLDPLTGNWGDRFGQKRIYLFGLLLWSVGFAVYGTAENFWMCAVAEALSGVGFAFRSEALESWLKNQSDEATVHEAQSDAGWWSKLATIPTALLGAWVGARWGLHWPWFLAGATSLLALGITYLLLREFSDKSRHHVKSSEDLEIWTITKRAWGDIRTRKVFILVSIFSACFMPFNMYWQRIFVASGITMEWMGNIWIGIAITTALGAKMAKKARVTSRNMATIVTSMGIPMFFPQYFGEAPIWLIAMFLLHEVARGMLGVAVWTYFNRTLDNISRTTVNSLRSSASSVGSVIGLVVSGLLANLVGLPQIWAVSAIVLLAAAVWVSQWNHD